MRLLKKKLLIAKQRLILQATKVQTPPRFQKLISKEPSCSTLRPHHHGDCEVRSYESEPSKLLSSKNVAKNYGRAICNFILSPLSEPYLIPLMEHYQIEERCFRKYVHDKRDGIVGMHELKGLLLIQNKDSVKIIGFKKSAQSLAETFIKFFSVNWIFSGKLTYKMEYLKFRNKLLRRVRNPELFTNNI